MSATLGEKGLLAGQFEKGELRGQHAVLCVDQANPRTLPPPCEPNLHCLLTLSYKEDSIQRQVRVLAPFEVFVARYGTDMSTSYGPEENSLNHAGTRDLAR